jgi:hypothetical protein
VIILDFDKGLTIGLTVFVGSANTSIWSNGAIQNFIFLYLLLNKISFVNEVIFINGGDSDVLSDDLMLGDLPIRLARLHDVVDQLDVLIEGGAQLDNQAVADFRAKGGRVVNYQFGNSFVMDMETTLFNRDSMRVFDGARVDEVWTIPQHEKTCHSFWQIMHRASVYVLPHIWSPIFIDKTIENIPNDGRFGYQANEGQKCITIFEPNLNVVKSYHYPVLVCEAAYRKDPSLIKAVFVTNTEHIKTNPTFQNFMCNTDIGAKGIATIENRFPIAHFLALHTDIVVTHQWENELNYLYYDVLYGNYPLIHNSKMLKGGYYYPSFDASAGADVLLDVLAHHDQNLEAYRAASQHCVASVSVDNLDNIKAYAEALLRVCQNHT